MKRSAFLLIGLALLAVQGLAAESGSVSPPAATRLKAEAMIGSSDTVRSVLVHGISQSAISLTLEETGHQISVGVKDVKRLHFQLDGTVESGLKALDERKYAAAANALRIPALRLMPYLAVPDNNLRPMMEAYVLALNQLDEPEALREFYTQWIQFVDDEDAKAAKAWMAYLDARDGLVEGVEAAFQGIGTLERGEEADRLRHLALCRVNVLLPSYRTAIDHAATVVAMAQVEDLLYPEAMFLSAQCYDGLAGTELARLAVEREGQLERELLNERVTVARNMEAEADKAGTASPTEQEILAKVDREAVNQRVPALPELKDIGHTMTAQRLYLILERVFPDTVWGEQAAERVLPESREGNDQKLSMSEKAPAPPPRNEQAKGESKQAAAKGETLGQFLARQNAGKNRTRAKNLKKLFADIDVNKDGRVTGEERRVYHSKK